MPSVAHGRGIFPDDPVTFTKRAELMGRMIIGPPVLDRMAARCGLPAGQISGLGRTTANVPDELTEPDSPQRASDIQASNATYRVEMQSRASQPIIDIYTEAPTVAAAECLANAAPVSLTGYLQTLAHAQGSTTSLPQVLPLGPARGGIANGGSTLIVAMLTFVTVFGTMIGALLALGWLTRRRRRPRSDEPDEEPLFVPESFSDPLPELVAGDPAEGRDSWPHTRRPLPWMIAFFLAVIWLTPFDNIQLKASLRVELRLDRLVLPFLVIVWLLALAAGGRKAPRLKMTWIHVALAGLLLATAFLSVVTDAQYLNHTLELQLSLKKLPLIVSYVMLFVIVASGVRRSEVRPFLTYTLVLAVVRRARDDPRVPNQAEHLLELVGQDLLGPVRAQRRAQRRRARRHRTRFGAGLGRRPARSGRDADDGASDRARAGDAGRPLAPANDLRPRDLHPGRGHVRHLP